MSLASRREAADAEVLAEVARLLQPGERVVCKATFSSKGSQTSMSFGLIGALGKLALDKRRNEQQPMFPAGQMMQAVLTDHRILVVSQKSLRGQRSVLGQVNVDTLASATFKKTRPTEMVDRVELTYRVGAKVVLEAAKKGSGAEEFVAALTMLLVVS